VPISLYISIEVVRTVQAYLIFDDYDIFYEKTMRRTTARSWNLSDDLGQIKYIFSDKTGTLTQNLMIFRELAVGGIAYHGDSPSASSDELGEKERNEYKAGASSESGSSDNKHDPQRKRVKPSNEDVAPFSDARLKAALRNPEDEHAKLQGWFWRCLALCHTVLSSENKETGMLEYKAQSPDEQALVQAAAEVGFTFCGKDRNTLRIQTPWSTEYEQYELLTVLEFTSARKRMSVILRRHSDDQIILFSKGADSVIFERSAAGQEQLKAETDEALEEFANKGLRTLCLGCREVESKYYEEWAHRYHEASVSLEAREERMEVLASELERELTLLGATAIEDRLQEGVPETIADLKRAGINVWVATGDKLETAIAIGYSTMLLSKDMNLIVVRGGEYGQPNSAYNQLRTAVERFFGGHEALERMEHQPPDEDLEEGRPSQSGHRPSAQARRSTASAASLVGEDNGERSGGFALVIDGAALGHALSEDFSKDLLLDISTQCKAVICCRVSPLQKALIVRLIKDGLGVMTLAIGDGANDVSMIQVSVSWSSVARHSLTHLSGCARWHRHRRRGRPAGRQLVRLRDRAVPLPQAPVARARPLVILPQQHHDPQLLLQADHQHRLPLLVPDRAYAACRSPAVRALTRDPPPQYCAWSTTQAIDYVYLLFWNAFWTVALVIAIGIFDRPISDRVLMEVPELYRRSREGRYFGLRPFLWFMLDGLYQATVLYFFLCYTYDTTTARSDGYDIQVSRRARGGRKRC
jgi:phospholipid-translocating ATPase